VLNGNGELIGLAFDGNYEALSHKMQFDKDLNRTFAWTSVMCCGVSINWAALLTW
jgi:hypothetical protein